MAPARPSQFLLRSDIAFNKSSAILHEAYSRRPARREEGEEARMLDTGGTGMRGICTIRTNLIDAAGLNDALSGAIISMSAKYVEIRSRQPSCLCLYALKFCVFRIYWIEIRTSRHHQRSQEGPERLGNT